MTEKTPEPSVWVMHHGGERTIPSHTPIEVRLHDVGFVRNCAGNIDNWRWRERSVQAYRILDAAEASELKREMMRAGQ